MILASLACLSVGCQGVSDVTVSPSLEYREPMRVAVLDFDWTAPVAQLQSEHSMINAPNAGKFIADGVSSRLLAIDAFEVLERSKLNRLLSEKDLTQSQLVQAGRFKEIGAFLGVDYLVLGTVNTYTTWASGMMSGHTVSFSCRCVNVNTSKVAWTISGRQERGPTGPMDPSVSLEAILTEASAKLKRGLPRRTAP